MNKICIILAAMKYQPERMFVLEKFLPTFVLFPPNGKPWPKWHRIEYTKKWLSRWRYLRFLKNRWNKRWWFKSETIYLRAYDDISELSEYDFFWCIEGDVWADYSVWEKLFSQTENDTSDLLCVYPKTRNSHPQWMWWKTAPKWAKKWILCAMYRLSSKSINWLIQDAQKNREVFSEINVPSTIHRYWWTISEINKLVPGIYDLESFEWNERFPNQVDKDRIWHAIKDDCF